MAKLTGFELEKRRQTLEQASASLLGHMIFEFSRIDMNLGLMLIGVKSEADPETRTNKISGFTFHKKLELLSEFSRLKYQYDGEAKDAHVAWLQEAHEIRIIRNSLIHGRWGIEAANNQVVNIVGLPTGEQTRNCYSISELKTVLVRLQALQKALLKLMTQYPV